MHRTAFARRVALFAIGIILAMLPVTGIGHAAASISIGDATVAADDHNSEATVSITYSCDRDHEFTRIWVYQRGNVGGSFESDTECDSQPHTIAAVVPSNDIRFLGGDSKNQSDPAFFTAGQSLDLEVQLQDMRGTYPPEYANKTVELKKAP
ncbi:hypothetical protein AB0L82_34035 [Nocardia sp. NPDC052001]|uniref:hypothetical protein n=1 Tax=Nocardia sp. NPDC052001 TaxID=3154853 RepID=UPI00341E1EBD